MNSRDKGKRGELEFRDELRRRGYEAERGQQRAGGTDSQDVRHNVPGVHFEVKRVERFNLYDAVNQARRDAGAGGNMPVVAHRCNASRKADDCRGEWLFIIGGDDFFRLLQSYRWWDAGILQRD